MKSDAAPRRVPHTLAAFLRSQMSPATWRRLVGIRSHLRGVLTPGSRPSQAHRPLLTVVMAAYNTQDYVLEALASLADQQYRHLEVIVVDDGSTDGTPEVVAAFARHDHRFRLIRHHHVGPGAARNIGAAEAQGTYLAFFDSDDVVNPAFYREAIESMERSGSDFAVGSYELLVRGRCQPPAPYIQEVHARDRSHIQLSDLPQITVSAVGCAKVYRRDFYTHQVGPQPEGVLYEDQLTSMRAYVRATGFDVLRYPALKWRRRVEENATSQRSADADNLTQRVQAYRQVSAFLDEAGFPEVREERLLQILATDQLTLRHVLVAEPRFFFIAQEFLRWAITQVDAGKYHERVTMPGRVLQRLITDTDLATAQSFLLVNGNRLNHWVFHLDPEVGVVGSLPQWELDTSVAIPLETRRPHAADTAQINPKNIFSQDAWEAVHSDPAAALRAMDPAATARLVFRCWYWKAHHSPQPRLYLQCGQGEAASGTLLALATELERRGLLTQIVWGVTSPGTPVPPGHARVVIESQEYYEELATSTVLCFDDEAPDVLVNRPGQWILQTHRGHPFLPLGIPWWTHQRLNAVRTRLALERCQRWDVMVSPSPLASRLYREALPVRADILEVGSPRNDALVLPDHQTRRSVRSQLKIADDQIAVLIADHAGDDGADDRAEDVSPAMLDAAGLAWLAKRLGESYVLMWWGRPLKWPEAHQGAHPINVVDVSTHQPVSEILLASDCAVFDYSPLRFDYVLTDKPMVSFTPDHGSFLECTPPLWPYQETVAGPWITEQRRLPGAIRQAITRDQWSADRHRLRELVAPLDDGQAAARLADRIWALLGD